MANVSGSTQGSGKLGDTQENTHSFIQAGQQVGRETLDNITEKATELYDEAGSWLGENYTKLLGGVAIVVGVGLIGYYLFQNFSSSDLNIDSKKNRGNNRRQKGSGQQRQASA